MPIQIRVLTWNIAEGNGDRSGPENSSLPGLAERVREFCPDILLLNEVLNFNVPGIKQAEELARRLFIPHTADSNHTPLSLRGAMKSVSIVSRYPLVNAIVHPVRVAGTNTSYCILEASTTILGRRHRLYSLRFDAWNQTNKLAGIAQIATMASTARSTEAVVLGGDFNTEASEQAMIDFANSSLTTNASDNPVTSEFVSVDGNKLVDAIFFRGPYKNQYFRAARDWAGSPNLSDHPYVAVDLVEEGNGLAAAFGARLKLKHWPTGAALHSHQINYGHEHGSSQQQVTGFTSRDDNDFWVIENAASLSATGTVINNGAEIRLRHEATGMWLQADYSFFAPVSSNTEVSAASIVGPNSVWVLELEKHSGPLSLGDRLRLRHKATGHYLYAIPGANGGTNTAHQQEICAAISRDSNTEWAMFEFHNPSGGLIQPSGWLTRILNLLVKLLKR